MKKYFINISIGVIICIIAIIIPITSTKKIKNNQINSLSLSTSIKYLYQNKDINNSNYNKIKLMELKTNYCDCLCYLNTQNKTILFFSKTFGINKEILINKLVEINSANAININNIGLVKDNNNNIIDYGSFEKGLIEYLYILSKQNPELFENSYIPYTGNSDYIENLIKYFTKIYNNVDYVSAISIAAAESGYFTAKGMLSYNNIYGGMGYSGLIKYKNIEYGVLSYIKYLSNNYYEEGKTTIEEIGISYCPTTNEQGQKIVSPHWINLVNKAKIKYNESTNNINIDSLIID